MERKYSYEAGLGVFTSFKTIVPVEKLEALGKVDTHQYHIYSILAYEQFYFKKEKTYCTPLGLHVTLFTTINGKEVEYELPIIQIERIDINFLNVELNMPYTSLILEIKDEEFLREHDQYRGKKEILYAQDMFLAFAKMIIQKTEFKVLYVGQAFGKNGSRTAFDRLVSHSTLQKILTDCQTKYANKHIYHVNGIYSSTIISF